MFGGKYYLEENLINPSTKSLQSKLVPLVYEKFHKYLEPEKENHYRIYHTNTHHIVAHSYVRSLYNSSRVFQNVFVEDENFHPLYLAPFKRLQEWKLKFYFLSK